MAGFTDPPAFALEHGQAEIGEGPGVEASERAETIAVTDLAEDPGYVRLWRRIAETGVRAVLASPVWVRGSVVGNLNAVRHRAHRWTEMEIRANEAYAKSSVPRPRRSRRWMRVGPTTRNPASTRI